jgi:hypothetical protein
MRSPWMLVVVALALSGCGSRTARAPSHADGGTPAPQPAAPTVATDTLIHVRTPAPGARVASPLVIAGEARGFWYFEAEFPARLLDGNGREIAIRPIRARGDWMTREFVPFADTLRFADPATPTGTLVLEKDNPSGLAAHAAAVRIPVRFR